MGTGLKQYLYNMLMALDQFFSTVLGGHPDDSISQRLGRAYLAGATPTIFFFKRLVDWLALVLVGEKNHCVSSLDGKSNVRELWNWGGNRADYIDNKCSSNKIS